MRIAFLLSLFLLQLAATAQINNVVRNNIQNKEWVLALEKLSLDSQLYAIKERVALDSTLVLSLPFQSGIWCKSGMDSVAYEKMIYRPARQYDSANLTAFPLCVIIPKTIKINYFKKLSLKELKPVLSLLDTQHISLIKGIFLKSVEMAALFGDDGWGGVIYIRTKNDKVYRRLKNILRRSSKS
jgi:hypothetical protein